MVMYAPLLMAGVACSPGSELGRDGAVDPIGYYESGWPIDACSTTFADEGTGYTEGDVLPQYEFIAQTGETVKLHDWCNQVVYIELGYFT